MLKQKRLIAEFEEQSFTQIIFPHEKTDWKPYLDEAQSCFVNIINTIIKFQPVLIICQDIKTVKKQFEHHPNLHFIQYETDDTWARDCSALSLEENDKVTLLDFTFNGWGGKFISKKDNAMTQTIQNCYKSSIVSIPFILEGGAIESNGSDTILTTTNCMLNINRNPDFNNITITQKLKDFFATEHILYLNHGYLAGDDTDSHIDTLARFIDKDTIMYAQCTNEEDEHYHQLLLMQEELQMIAQERNLKLIPLPFCDAIYYEDERLPATYANFLFVNGAVLVPTYGVKQDNEALDIFAQTFPNREIIAVDSSVLIRQHGSLHCVTMNFAAGVEISC